MYERPRTEFVAGFVGVSNVIERDGRQITIRPEKIHMVPEEAPADTAEHWEPGRIRDVVYVGMVTRYLVELDRGGELVVVRAEPRDLLAAGAGGPGQAGPARLGGRSTRTDHPKEGDEQ